MDINLIPFTKYNEFEILYLAKNVIIVKPWISNIKKKYFILTQSNKRNYNNII